MEDAGHNAHYIHEKTGVHQTTTFRFITGLSGEPKVGTVRKWANFYGVTEAQLRGEEPINGMPIKKEPKELKELLPMDEYEHLSNIKKLPEPERDMLYKLSARLAAGGTLGDRRVRSIFPNNQLRFGESRNKAPVRKMRFRESTNAKKQTGT